MDKSLADRIDANRNEYERLLIDDKYTNVRFNSRNGALSAIHKEHNFDPTIGIFGIPRGDYELISLDVRMQAKNVQRLWFFIFMIKIFFPKSKYVKVISLT
jgi:hypothetical protein